MAETLEARLNRLRPRLLATLRRKGRPEDAEDGFGELALRALRNPPSAEVADLDAWLFGIARRVSLPRPSPLPEAKLFDLDETLEQRHLAEQLAALLAPLEPSARRLLLDHDAFGIDLTSLAQREKTTPNALAARLVRLRRKLVDELTEDQREAFAAYGIAVPRDHATSIWCPRCGDAQLRTCRQGDKTVLTCPRCAPDALFVAEGRATQLVDGTPRIALRRFLTLARRNLQRWHGDPGLRCPSCQAAGSVQARAADRRLECRCQNCPHEAAHDVWELALATPVATAFWRQHGRIHQVRSPQSFTLVSRRTSDALSVALCPKTGLPLS